VTGRAASTGLRGSDRFLPPDPRVEEPFRLTPKLAFRLALLGALALGLFGVLFFRLWALQVLSGPQYLNAALNNQVRSVPVEAQRGTVYDRNGKVLVENKAGTAVQIWPADLPKNRARRLNELRRLSKVVRVPVSQILVQLRKRSKDPVTPVTVREGIHRDQIYYLSEHKLDFPGVKLAQTYLRRYPYQALGAQLLGYVGEISPDQLKALRGKGYRLGDKIGQSGVESAYDAYLRGRDGVAELRVDSLGRPRSPLLVREQPQTGQSIRLTIDIGLQRAAERAIRYGIQRARSSDCVGCWSSNGGAIVALDPRSGEVLAMASNPTYMPSVLAGRADRKKLAPLLSPNAARDANYPALNRALVGLYPSGSTFKPVTALAALQERVVSAYDELPCTGSYTVAGQTFKNWDPYASSSMTLPTAIAASCDTYFYQLGYRFYQLPPERGQPLQLWARRFGFGSPSDIDVGPEASGLVPTIAWKKRTFTPKADPCCWRIDQLWKPGDSIQLSIGQKDVLVTPMQMARFYALVANGGRLVKPHVVEDVEQGGDARAPARILHTFAPPPAQRVRLDPTGLAVVRDGLYQATHANYGTSAGIFSTFPVEIAGKTGTAEKSTHIPGFTGMVDQSWWCGYGPANDTPRIVVCAVIENGGHGADAAAPAALKVFEQYFHTRGAPQEARGD
jgi:penicillin-binding protein 2